MKTQLYYRFDNRYLTFFKAMLIAGIWFSLAGCGSSGRMVTLFRGQEKPVTGRLITARDGCVLVDTLNKYWGKITIEDKKERQEAWQKAKSTIVAVSDEDIKSVNIEGESYILEGLLAGVGLTVVLMTMAEKSETHSGLLSDPQDRATLAAAFLGPIVLGAGVAVGVLCSRSKEVVYTEYQRASVLIEKHAMFRENIPAELDSLRYPSEKR